MQRLGGEAIVGPWGASWIVQQATCLSPRSTVGTVTGIQDYLRRQWDIYGRVIRSKQISLSE